MISRGKLYFTVISDPTYDQRMIRICSSLSLNGYEVVLIGRKFDNSVPSKKMPFVQKGLFCIFNKGFFHYAEFNCRLFCYLLFQRIGLICAVDLDTIIPCYLISRIKRIPRVYDAHELFCEMKEIVTRPRIYKCWKSIERLFVPKFVHGYTVNQIIADEFNKMYGRNYAVIRNIPLLTSLCIPEKKEKYILYQGAVNEGRSFETLIPAMKQVNACLIICGDGNFMRQARYITDQHDLNKKVIFKGKLLPADLKEYSLHAWIGVTLFDKQGLSNYYSLANRFFDYLHAGVPQICVNYPAYREINNDHPFAVLIDDLEAESIARELNNLLNDEILYARLQENCLIAREIFNWQEEERKLLSFYNKILSPAG